MFWRSWATLSPPRRKRLSCFSLSLLMAVDMCVWLSMYPSFSFSVWIYLAIRLSVWLPVCSSVCQYICLSIHPSSYLYVYLFICQTACQAYQAAGIER
jgi:hypothetical protein